MTYVPILKVNVTLCGQSSNHASAVILSLLLGFLNKLAYCFSDTETMYRAYDPCSFLKSQGHTL